MGGTRLDRVHHHTPLMLLQRHFEKIALAPWGVARLSVYCTWPFDEGWSACRCDIIQPVANNLVADSAWWPQHLHVAQSGFSNQPVAIGVCACMFGVD